MIIKHIRASVVPTTYQYTIITLDNCRSLRQQDLICGINLLPIQQMPLLATVTILQIGEKFLQVHLLATVNLGIII